jgi:hypothetical protein
MAGRNLHITLEKCVKIVTAVLKLAKLQERQLGFFEGKSLKSSNFRRTSVKKFLNIIVYFVYSNVLTVKDRPPSRHSFPSKLS